MDTIYQKFDVNRIIQQCADEFMISELTALVGVDYVWSAKPNILYLQLLDCVESLMLVRHLVP